MSSIPNSIFNCENHKGIKLITKLRIGLSHLREHKFKYSFQDKSNPICSCDFDAESNSHYDFHCPMYSDEKHTLLSTVKTLILDC